MKNIHVLPTDKPSRLRYNLSNILVLTKEPYRDYSKQVNQNIYITSDEEIKQGDWFVYKTENKTVLLKAEIIHIDTITVSNNIKVGTWVSSKYCKKIILTTDQDLIEDGVQAIDDEFLEWFVKNSSCEKVEIGYGWIRLTETDNEGYWVSIPDEEFNMQKEEPKQETLEEAIVNFALKHFLFPDELFFKMSKCSQNDYLLEEEFGLDNTTKYREILGFIEGAKFQQKRMYSENEVRIMLSESFKASQEGYNITSDEIIEQFKKKV